MTIQTQPVKRMNRSVCLVVLFVLCVFFEGCGVPGWIRKVPTEKDAIYAIGTGDPGWWNPPMEAAVKEAQKEIGRTIQTRVSSVLLVQSFGSTTYVDEVAEEFSDTIVEGATLEDKWLDTDGLMGVQDRLYVLMRFSRKDFVDGLKKTVEKKPPKEEAAAKEPRKPVDVEKAANLAFAELDKAIAQKNKSYQEQANCIPK